MLRRLKECQVGTEDVEHLMEQQLGTRRSVGRGKNSKVGRKERREGVVFLLDQKIKDNLLLECQRRKERGRARKGLERIMGGRNKRQCRNFIAGLSKEMEDHRSKVRKKNDDKVDFLVEKWRGEEKKKNSLPPSLSRYQGAKIFQEECLMAAETLGGAVIVEDENGETVKFDEDEIALLMKSPKFSVYRNLTKEDFMEVMEVAFIKHRWDMSKRLEEGDVQQEEGDEEEVERLQKVQVQLEAESRMIFTEKDRVFDWGRQRVTDAKNN